MEIKFQWKGQAYTAPMSAYEDNMIELPDGTLLTADSWLESLPPQPRGHKIVSVTKAERGPLTLPSSI